MKDKQFRILIPLLFNVSRLIREHTTMARPDFVSALRLEALRFIDEKKPTMRELSDYLRITPPSATPLVKALRQKKLIALKHLSSDRRTIHLSVTPLGRRSMKKCASDKALFLKHVFSNLTPSEISIIVSILKRLQRQYQVL